MKLDNYEFDETRAHCAGHQGDIGVIPVKKLTEKGEVKPNIDGTIVVHTGEQAEHDHFFDVEDLPEDSVKVIDKGVIEGTACQLFELQLKEPTRLWHGRKNKTDIAKGQADHLPSKVLDKGNYVVTVQQQYLDGALRPIFD